MPDLISSLFAPERTASDYFILAAFFGAAWFAISYALFSPWYKVQDHGWIGVMTLLHSWSVAALLFLIVWAIIFGQRIGEEVRLPISIFLALATMTKVVILHHERRTGRIARRKARLAAQEKELA